MHEFTSEEIARWDAWKHAYAVSARRSDRIARLFAVAAFAVLLTTLAIVMLQ